MAESFFFFKNGRASKRIEKERTYCVYYGYLLFSFFLFSSKNMGHFGDYICILLTQTTQRGQREQVVYIALILEHTMSGRNPESIAGYIPEMSQRVPVSCDKRYLVHPYLSPVVQTHPFREYLLNQIWTDLPIPSRSNQSRLDRLTQVA